MSSFRRFASRYKLNDVLYVIAGYDEDNQAVLDIVNRGLDLGTSVEDMAWQIMDYNKQHYPEEAADPNYDETAALSYSIWEISSILTEPGFRERLQPHHIKYLDSLGYWE